MDPMGKSRGCLLSCSSAVRRGVRYPRLYLDRRGLYLVHVSVAGYIRRGGYLPQRGQLLTEFSCSPKSPVPPLSLATGCGIADAAALWSDGVGLRVRWQMNDAVCARLKEWGGRTAAHCFVAR